MWQSGSALINGNLAIKFNTVKISQCLLNAHVITLQMWPRCICGAAQAHLSGWDWSTLLTLGLWEAGVMTMKGTIQHKLLKFVLPVSIPALSHTGWERYWGVQNSCCPCLHEHRATCLLLVVYVLELCHKEILSNGYRIERLGQAEKGCHHTRVTVFMQ